MPRILYGISPIGLGHATRSLVIIRRLIEEGVEVQAYTGGNAAAFLREKGVDVVDLVEDAMPTVSGLEMSRVSLWYIRSWLAQRKNVERARRLLGTFRPGAVVCDEEFSGMVAAEGRGVRRVFIADELSLGFARGWLARKIEGRVARWYTNLVDGADLALIPDEGRDSGNKRHVGPIVRGATMGAERLRGAYGLPQGRVVLLSMSGSGAGRELAEPLIDAMDQEGLRDVTLIVSGNRGERLTGSRVRDLGVVPDNQDLVACADLVVSTAGKSTIDEAAASGTPIIAIPIRHHVEQERNAAELGYSWDDLARLPTLVAERIGKRSAARVFDGEVRAADLILGLLRRPSD